MTAQPSGATPSEGTWLTPRITRLGGVDSSAGGEGLGLESDTPTAGPS